MQLMDRWLFRDTRSWICGQVTGEVLEVAIGTGLNLPHYPADIALTGMELSPAMLDVAGSSALLRTGQWLLERASVPIGGEHFLRRPIEHVRAAGLKIERHDRFALGMVERLTARKAAA